MTDVMERTCTAEEHAPSQKGWAAGCRCKGAVAAHKARLIKDRSRVEGPAVDADGNCIAERHNTLYAYKVYGCRCPEARDASRRSYHRKKRARAASSPWVDPRLPWRGPDMQVDRLTLRLLTSGTRMVGRPTKGELLAAVCVLRGRLKGYGPRLEFNDTPDIARVLGLTSREVKAIEDIRYRIRDSRARRRAADAAYRAHRSGR